MTRMRLLVLSTRFGKVGLHAAPGGSIQIQTSSPYVHSVRLVSVFASPLYNMSPQDASYQEKCSHTCLLLANERQFYYTTPFCQRHSRALTTSSRSTWMFRCGRVLCLSRNRNAVESISGLQWFKSLAGYDFVSAPRSALPMYRAQCRKNLSAQVCK